MTDLIDFCTTDRQRQVVTMRQNSMSNKQIATKLGLDPSTVCKAYRLIETRAALKGVAPRQGLNHPTIPGFNTKRVSTAYNASGDPVMQWHIQEKEKVCLKDLSDTIRDSFETKPCLLKPEKKELNSSLASCYVVGDHHFGMFADGLESWQKWDMRKSYNVLTEVCNSLVSRSPPSEIGYLINLGDFFHADDSTKKTRKSGNSLDVDGSFGIIARTAGMLMKSLAELLLQKHNKVVIINARGNHDIDSSVWLNEVLRAYFINHEQVEVVDNFRKFIWFEFGKNLVVTHHGDGLKWDQMHKAIVSNLPKEWGRTKFRFGWTGHQHHSASQEIGGMYFERFGVLAPSDAWHTGAGYGSNRTMSSITLHKEGGVYCRNVVSI